MGQNIDQSMGNIGSITTPIVSAPSIFLPYNVRLIELNKYSDI